MDLLQTVRKEGSRGGVNFSWDEVKSSQHRENYLGHSLMAPVGRWQKNKDLGWYAKADDADLTPEERAEKERVLKREEMRKVKEAEEDAMARALGLPVPDRSESNANDVPLGMSRDRQREVNQALKEALDEGDDEDERGIGFGKYEDTAGDDGKEVLKGSRPRDGGKRAERRDHNDEKHRRKRRSRSRSRSKERRHRHADYKRPSSLERRRRSRSPDRYRHREETYRRRRERNERSRSRDRNRRKRRSRSRSRSPYQSRRHPR